jgi:hypothetical protein
LLPFLSTKVNLLDVVVVVVAFVEFVVGREDQVFVFVEYFPLNLKYFDPRSAIDFC